jgi:hypothetical protein
LNYARSGEVEKADAIGDLFVLVFDRVWAEEAEAALQFLQLCAGHRVVGKILGAFGHDGVILAYSLFVRLRHKGKNAQPCFLQGLKPKCRASVRGG